MASRLLPLGLLVLMAGCSSFRPWINAPLAPGETARYDGIAQFYGPDRSSEMLVVANFSGGGSRAAAFAYEVVRQLDGSVFDWAGRETTLAREIDLVTGVSGGSVAAAHLALHGTGDHLERFPGEFLDLNFQGRLTRALLSPRHWARESSPYFGRGNLLAAELDTALFHGATFGDLAASGKGPFLIVGATDLSSGGEFDFTADELALLCSSIDQVPLSFAVASSSAVPGLFAPLTLASHHRGCPRPLEAQRNLAVTHGDAARTRLVKAESGSLAHGEREFIHLIDGGVSDNLGIRRITDYVAQSGGISNVLALLATGQPAGPPRPRWIVVVSVSSERKTGLALDRSAKVPSVLSVVNAMLYSGLGRQSMESSLVFRDAVEEWRRELAADPALRGAVDIFNIEVNLSELEDAALREKAMAIPTAFRISQDDLEVLRQAAIRGLGQSADYRRFRESAGVAGKN